MIIYPSDMLSKGNSISDFASSLLIPHSFCIDFQLSLIASFRSSSSLVSSASPPLSYSSYQMVFMRFYIAHPSNIVFGLFLTNVAPFLCCPWLAATSFMTHEFATRTFSMLIWTAWLFPWHINPPKDIPTLGALAHWAIMVSYISPIFPINWEGLYITYFGCVNFRPNVCSLCNMTDLSASTSLYFCVFGQIYMPLRYSLLLSTPQFPTSYSYKRHNPAF